MLKEAGTMEWRAFLAKPERIKKNALYRINVSAPRHGDIFFYAFWEKHIAVIFMNVAFKFEPQSII